MHKILPSLFLGTYLQRLALCFVVLTSLAQIIAAAGRTAAARTKGDRIAAVAARVRRRDGARAANWEWRVVARVAARVAARRSTGTYWCAVFRSCQCWVGLGLSLGWVWVTVVLCGNRHNASHQTFRIDICPPPSPGFSFQSSLFVCVLSAVVAAIAAPVAALGFTGRWLKSSLALAPAASG